ncbi:MAG: MMPL family transporter [Myxococcales bacterium]|nr:MMPL family transporter [Myxococcales bacterium]
MDEGGTRVERLLAAIIARRILVVVVWLLLLPVGVWLALQIPSDGAIDRLVVESDPDVVLTRSFQKVFPEGRQLVLLFQPQGDPFSPEAVRELGAVEDAVGKLPGVVTFSALSIFRRKDSLLDADGYATRYKAFAFGTPLFKKQGLVGDHHASMAVTFAAPTSAARDAMLEKIDEALAQTPHGALGEVRRVGQPYLENWLENETRSATVRYFPLFGAFVVVLVLALYRSVRALLAILLTLGVTVALAVGLGHLLGFSLTIVSEVMPLVVLVTTTATLVYLHSRYIQQPKDVPLERHHVFALANKALPVTASLIAALVGFAALAVSQIRPIREMGLWTAGGLALSWLTSFTLFPALQRLFKAPTRPGETPAGQLYTRMADALPGFTYRYRWALLAMSLLGAAAGGAALFGVPGTSLAPMPMGVDALDYIDEDLPVRKDLMAYEKAIAGLAAVRVWVRLDDGQAVEPAALQAIDRFTTAVSKEEGVTSVVGPTTILRLRRYLAGQGDALPEDPEAFAAATADLEQLLLTEKELRGFIDLKTMGQVQVMVLTRRGTAASFERLKARLDALWKSEQARSPALAKATQTVVGESIMQAKIATHLVPTLTESFGLTALLIFLTFLVVFRSGAARVMAMVPSVFAILATFLVMRLTGMPLNVATILIATTVLGTTENDQVHFFHHYQEAKRDGASVEQSLRHTLHVSGHAIIFATLINMSGFLALSFSNLPPMREFGVVTSIAFAFSMLADFTALPAALWIVMRAKPDQLEGKPP